MYSVQPVYDFTVQLTINGWCYIHSITHACTLYWELLYVLVVADWEFDFNWNQCFLIDSAIKLGVPCIKHAICLLHCMIYWIYMRIYCRVYIEQLCLYSLWYGNSLCSSLWQTWCWKTFVTTEVWLWERLPLVCLGLSGQRSSSAAAVETEGRTPLCYSVSYYLHV